MKKENDFLEYLYQSVCIVKEFVISIIKNKTYEIEKTSEIYIFLKEQLNQYNKILKSIQDMIKRRKKVNETFGIIPKLATYISVRTNIKNDDDIINILANGSNSQIEDIKLKIKEYEINSKTILNLSTRLINIEKNNLNLLKNINSNK